MYSEAANRRHASRSNLAERVSRVSPRGHRVKPERRWKPKVEYAAFAKIVVWVKRQRQLDPGEIGHPFEPLVEMRQRDEP